MVVTRSKRTSALVIGGAGFLGAHIVSKLLQHGGYDVAVFDLHEPAFSGIQVIRGDLSILKDVEAACMGRDVVFHVATAAPTALNVATAQDLMVKVNVLGTENVIKACKAAKVPRLVFTSTASVVFKGKDLIDIDESCPYASKPMDYYTGTKIQAEKLVLAANSPALATCALRPSGIFGPGNDRILMPSIVERGQNGKIKYIVGSGTNLFDWTYVGNVADAHLLGADSLADPNSGAAGQAFFITNDEPSQFWGMLGDLSEGLGYARPHIKLPVWIMMIFAYLAIFFGTLLGFKPDISPTRVRLSSVQRTMRCDKAKRILGYKPEVSMARGKELTIAAFQHLSKNEVGKRKNM